MPRPDIVVVDRLVKRYGPRLAVGSVSFSIAEGEIIGLLGPNGSGKSTVLRILTGYLPPSEGSVRIGGYNVLEQPQEIRRRIGYVPEDAPLYDGMLVGEFLRFMAELKGVPRGEMSSAVAVVCERLGLRDVVGTPIGKLSRGYRQRSAIAQALLNDPPILIFDEPTNALDAYQVIAVRELITGMAGKRTVIVASHVLTEIEKMATRVMVLRDGVLLTADAMAETSDTARYRLRIAGAPEAVLVALRSVPGVVRANVVGGASADAAGWHYYLLEGGQSEVAHELGRAVIQHGFALAELVPDQPGLEQVFLELTQRATEAVAA